MKSIPLWRAGWLALALLAAAPGARGQAVVIDGGDAVGVPSDRASPWVVGNALTVGGSGAGALTVRDGGVVSNSGGTVGSLAGSSGAVTVSGAGSQWTNSGNLTIGNRGAGALAVLDGGAVSSSQGLIGAYARGAVDVDGAGSSWTMRDGLTIGVYTGGEGTLNVTRGGKLSMSANTTAISIGNSPGATGVVNVDGAGSALTINGPSIVARGGTGALNITNGGVVTITGNTMVELDTGAVATVRVDGAGSRWNISGYLDVGYGGTGAMHITNGGVVSSGSGYIASELGTDNIVTVDGPGSTWANGGALYIGSAGRGALTIRNGGLVTAPTLVWADAAGGSGAIYIGAAPGDAPAGPGTLDSPTVRFGTRASRLVFNHADDSGSYVFAPAITSSSASADSAVSVEAGVTVMTGASTYYGPTAIGGGALVAGRAGVLSSRSGYAVQPAGALRLDSNQTVASLSNAGQVDLGAQSATLTVTGAYEGQGGDLVIDATLGDDASATDRLVAGSTSGETTLRIVNTGGLGALTDEGIQVVRVLGESGGAFKLASQVIAGDFEYELAKAGDGNWYLQSKPYTPPPAPPLPAAAATPVAVPAMSEIPLALLALLLTGGAAIALRRYQ